MLESGNVAIEVVNKFEKTLERNGSSLPEDIVEEREKSRQFSKNLAKKLTQRMKMDELMKEYEKVSELKIHTHKITKLNQIISKAQEWTNDAKATVGCEVQLNTLTKLITEAKKMNIDYDLFDEISKRQSKALALISKVDSNDAGNESRKTRSKQKRVTKNKINKEEAADIMSKLSELKVQNSKIDAIKEHLELIESWEKESKEVLSLPIDQMPIEKLDSLIERSKFKYVVNLVAEVQSKLDYLEWKEDAKQIIESITNSKSENEDNKENSKDQEEAKDSQGKAQSQNPKVQKRGITLEEINKLIEEGKKKGYQECKEMTELMELEEKINEYKSRILLIFETDDSNGSEQDSDIDDSANNHSESSVKSKIESLQAAEGNWNKKNFYKNKCIVKGTKIHEVNELIEEGNEFHLNLCVVEILSKEMKEIDKWVSTAKLILDTNKNEDLSFTSIESLYELSQDFRIESETTIKIQNAIKPIINWKEDAEKFIEKNTNKLKSKNKKKAETGVSNKAYEVMCQLPQFFEDELVEQKDQEMEINDPDPQPELFGNQINKNENITCDNEEIKKQDQEVAANIIKEDKESEDVEMKDSQNALDESEPNCLIVLQKTEVCADVSIKKQSQIEDLNDTVMNVIQDSTPAKQAKTNKVENIADKIPSYKTYPEIDDLLNEKGELRQSSHFDGTEDKELNEKLDNLMKDLRGRTRRFKTEIENKEEIKEQKNIENSDRRRCSPKKIVYKGPKVGPLILEPRNEFSPPKKYWLKFDKIKELYNKICEFIKATDEWKQRFELVIPTLLIKNDENEEGDVLEAITDSMINNAISTVSNIMANSSKSNSKVQKSSENEKGTDASKNDNISQVQVIFDTTILNRMQIIIDKLQWIKKLKALYSKTTSSTSKSRDDASEKSLQKYFGKDCSRKIEVNFKKLEALEKEASKFAKPNDLKVSQPEAAIAKQPLKTQKTSKLEFNIFDQIYEEFLVKYNNLRKWVEKFEEFNSINDKVNDNKSDENKEDEECLWSMKELEELIDLGTNLEFVPVEYKDIVRIYKDLCDTINYLHINLKSYGTLATLVAGILISQDFAQKEEVVK